jgi:hypothetical protein
MLCCVLRVLCVQKCQQVDFCFSRCKMRHEALKLLVACFLYCIGTASCSGVDSSARAILQIPLHKNAIASDFR